MSEKPILFSAPMVRAVLAGTKTQTRRALRVQPPANTVQVSTWHHPDQRPMFYAWTRAGGPVADHLFGGAEISDWEPVPCPYGKPGDRLWVREAFAIVPRTAYRCSEGVQQTLRPGDDHDAAIYREGWTRSNSGFRWRPSIHMPRWASRITLEVTGVRVERLQGISAGDCIAEGIDRRGPGWAWYTDPKAYTDDPRTSYRDLWESINGPGSWDANPWVWVVEFRRIDAAMGEKP